jgi:hypothetical protein
MMDRQKLRNKAKSQLAGIGSLLIQRSADNMKIEEMSDNDTFIVRTDQNGNIVKTPKVLNMLEGELKYIAKSASP